MKTFLAENCLLMPAGSAPRVAIVGFHSVKARLGGVNRLASRDEVAVMRDWPKAMFTVERAREFRVDFGLQPKVFGRVV